MRGVGWRGGSEGWCRTPQCADTTYPRQTSPCLPHVPPPLPLSPSPPHPHPHPQWHDDYNYFKNMVKDYEVMYQNVINTAFDGVSHVSDGVALLEIFYSLAKRDAIRQCVEKKTADV